MSLMEIQHLYLMPEDTVRVPRATVDRVRAHMVLGKDKGMVIEAFELTSCSRYHDDDSWQPGKTQNTHWIGLDNIPLSWKDSYFMDSLNGFRLSLKPLVSAINKLGGPGTEGWNFTVQIATHGITGWINKPEAGSLIGIDAQGPIPTLAIPTEASRIITKAAVSLEVGRTAILITEPGGLFHEQTTSSGRAPGRAITESYPELLTAWIDRIQFARSQSGRTHRKTYDICVSRTCGGLLIHAVDEEPTDKLRPWTPRLTQVLAYIHLDRTDVPTMLPGPLFACAEERSGRAAPRGGNQ